MARKRTLKNTAQNIFFVVALFKDFHTSYAQLPGTDLTKKLQNCIFLDCLSENDVVAFDLALCPG
jgi:hypothetical protein